MKMMECVEVIVEKPKYVKEGVHKGMQGVIWEEEKKDGCWVVLFPQYGDKEDIADLYSSEEDLKEIRGIDARVNEQIKAEFDALTKQTKHTGGGADDNSPYMV